MKIGITGSLSSGKSSVAKILSKNKYKLFNNKFKKEIKFLLSKLNYKNDTFVHRDFHVSNLILNFNKKIGIIDSQDALIGNKVYDLASLIDDVRFKTSNVLKNKVYNYYGLIEQTGSIFFESEKCGFFTTNEFSEILIRDKNFKIAPNGTKGFVQLLSLLPTSYPGHSILTEDIGQIFNIKNCKCGNDAKHFLIHGRLKESELRGCSDV